MTGRQLSTGLNLELQSVGAPKIGRLRPVDSLVTKIFTVAGNIVTDYGVLDLDEKLPDDKEGFPGVPYRRKVWASPEVISGTDVPVLAVSRWDDSRVRPDLTIAAKGELSPEDIPTLAEFTRSRGGPIHFKRQTLGEAASVLAEGVIYTPDSSQADIVRLRKLSGMMMAAYSRLSISRPPDLDR